MAQQRKVLSPDERAAMIQEQYGGQDYSWQLQKVCAAQNAAQQDQERKAIQASVIRRPKGFVLSAQGSCAGTGMRVR
jgi:hypothetical protein